MLKAAAGGGGRGMKVVSKEEDLLKGLQITRSEAKLAFSNAEFIRKISTKSDISKFKF